MGGDGRKDDGPGGLPSQDRKTYYGDGGEEGHRRGMVVGLGGCGTGGNRSLANKGVREELPGNNSGLCCRESNLGNMYRRREYGGIQ